MTRVHFVDYADDDLEEEDRPQRFTRSRRRTRGDQKHTSLAQRQVEAGRDFFRRLVRKGRVDSALVRVHFSEEPFSDADRGVVRDLLEMIAKSGLRVAENVLPWALAGLRSCAEWFVETAPPHAILRLYAAINEEIRQLCAGCKLLAEILAPKVALVAA